MDQRYEYCSISIDDNIKGDRKSNRDCENGLADILVELRRQAETLRRLTDGIGHFAFEDLRPGQWELKVYDKNLPEYHYLESNLFRIQLEPGGKQTCNINVLFKQRQIRMLKGGGILSDRKDGIR